MAFKEVAIGKGHFDGAQRSWAVSCGQATGSELVSTACSRHGVKLHIEIPLLRCSLQGLEVPWGRQRKSKVYC